jgi:hypothetical protein
MERHCDRPACNQLAVATLSFAYAGRTVWLDHLAVDDDPPMHDLCVMHADRLTVPLGWSLQDRRTAVPQLFRSPLAS